jgi:GT2 family glycosyltransferase
MMPAAPAGHAALRRPVTIVIVTWNGLAHTRRCLDHLATTTQGLPVEIVVVDNASTDGTRELLRGSPGLRCVLRTDNGGFAAGVNDGIRAADPGSDIVLLNNDIIADDPQWLPGLAETASRHGAGLVSARLHYPDGRLQDPGNALVFDPFKVRHFGIFEPDVGQFGSARPVPAVSFACVYIRREVIERIGLLDAERYFCYFEDIDYCLRARDAGFSIWCAGAVRLTHVEHGSSAAAAGELLVSAERAFLSRWAAACAPDPRRTVAVRIPEGASWERRELLRALALGLEARGWRMLPRRVQQDGGELPCEELVSQWHFDDLWRNAAARHAQAPVASIDIAEHGRALRVAAAGGAELWSLDGGGGSDRCAMALAPDRDYFRPTARRAPGEFRWLAILAGARAEEAWSVFCRAACSSARTRCIRMETLPVPYDLRWSANALVVRAERSGLEVRRHTWAQAVERVQLYAQADACVLTSGPADLGLAALELAAMGVPIAAVAADLPAELRSPACAGLLPDDAGFAAALRDRATAWSRDPAAARRTGQRAALAVGRRSWAQLLDAISRRLEVLTGAAASPQRPAGTG